MEVRCNLFVDKSKSSSAWAFSNFRVFTSSRKRVRNREISPAALRYIVKSTKLFCEMTDIEIAWNKICEKENEKSF